MGDGDLWGVATIGTIGVIWVVVVEKSLSSDLEDG